MKEIGKIHAVVGKKAIVKLNKSDLCNSCGACIFSGESDTINVISQNTINAKEDEEVLVSVRERFSRKTQILFQLIPLFFLLIGFGVGFLLNNELAHFGIMVGLYGFSMLIMINVKNSTDYSKRFIYSIEKKEEKE